MTKSWIYHLTKDRLIKYLTDNHIDTTGTCEELRKKMSNFVDLHPELFREDVFDEQPSASGGAKPKLPPTRPAEMTVPQLSISSPPLTDVPNNDFTNTINQIRKWGVSFNGRDPISFLERVEELRYAYGYDTNQLFTSLPELLRGDALLWYRNYRTQWRCWQDFVNDFQEQFFPYRYKSHLEREIRERLQKNAEPFTKYAADLQTLMRRIGNLSPREQLDRLYDNMHPDYKLYVRRQDTESIARLRQQAIEFETIRAEQTLRVHRTVDAASEPTRTVAAVYNRTDCCWRCKQRGHTRFACQTTPKKFCSICGKDGRLTRDCHPKCRTGRETTVQTRPTENVKIRYQPRPHLDVTLWGRPFTALLDTGSEGSFVTGDIISYAEEHERLLLKRHKPIILANGTQTTCPGSLSLPLQVGKTTYQHDFSVMRGMKSEIIIGVDLWAKIGLTLPPPPNTSTTATPISCDLTKRIPEPAPTVPKYSKSMTIQKLISPVIVNSRDRPIRSQDIKSHPDTPRQGLSSSQKTRHDASNQRPSRLAALRQQSTRAQRCPVPVAQRLGVAHSDRPIRAVTNRPSASLPSTATNQTSERQRPAQPASRPSAVRPPTAVNQTPDRQRPARTASRPPDVRPTPPSADQKAVAQPRPTPLPPPLPWQPARYYRTRHRPTSHGPSVTAPTPVPGSLPEPSTTDGRCSTVHLDPTAPRRFTPVVPSKGGGDVTMRYCVS